MNTSSYSIALDGIAKLASDHVLQMKAWSENYLRSPPSYPSDLRAYYTPRIIDGRLDAYTLDEVPAEERRYIGQLVWLGDDPRDSDVVNVALDQALEFFSLARLTHDVTPYFQWSYFFSSSKDVLAVYPWFSAEDIVAASGYTTLKDALASWFEYEIYVAGTPGQNPEGTTYWTEPYIDAGGTGAMVSLGAPVYVKDVFKGIVGTDVRLATLEKFLNGLPMDVGRLVILNSDQMLLADTAGAPVDAISKAGDALPGALADETFIQDLQTTGEIIDTNGHVLVAHDIPHAPWTLVYLISDEEISGLLLPRLLPYAVILAVLAITVFIALYVLKKEFISPALALISYIRDVSRHPLASEPRLPELWQTWAGLIRKTFELNHKAVQLIQESEERLQQILNNSSAVVYVRDREERFILVNQPFERLLDVKQED
ncbi:MAG: PAS domain-containing protein, partial [Gammaproteobacteria bacterium]